MTSISQNPKDMNSVKSQGCIFVRHMNKQLRVICINVEFDVGMRSNNLTQRISA